MSDDIFGNAAAKTTKDIEATVIDGLMLSINPPPYDELMFEYNTLVGRMRGIEFIAEHQDCCELCEYHMTHETQMRLHSEYCELIQKVKDIDWKFLHGYDKHVPTNFNSPFDTRDWY
jgi:hypothetical protein